MNNQNINDLPPIERLTAARKLNLGHPVSNKKTKADVAKIISGLNPNSVTDCLVAARLGVNLKPVQPKKVEEPASARHGAQIVYDDEGKIVGFFPGYSDDE